MRADPKGAGKVLGFVSNLFISVHASTTGEGNRQPSLHIPSLEILLEDILSFQQPGVFFLFDVIVRLSIFFNQFGKFYFYPLKFTNVKIPTPQM